MNWYPDKRVGILWGLGLLAALGYADYCLLRGLMVSPVNLVFFVRALLLSAALLLLVFLAYALYGLLNLAYHVERNGIVIRWAASYDVVPMSDIRAIEPFRSGQQLVPRIGWPGYRIGQVEVEGIGAVRLYTTRPVGEALLIRTTRQAYLISPANVEGFLADVRARRLLGPIARWTQEQRLPALFNLPVWRDQLVHRLFLPGLLLNLALFGYLAARYPQLPPRMILSYDPRGLGERIGARSDLFLLPLGGLAILLLNGVLAAWVHRRGRVLSLLLLGNVSLVQALAWVVTSRLLG